MVTRGGPAPACWRVGSGCPVKVVATLGPSSMEEAVVSAMLTAGAAGFRVNTSHGGPGVWDEMLRSVRAAEERVGVKPAIIFDLEGPRLRVRWASRAWVGPGGRVRICRSPGEDCVVLSYPEVVEELEEGDLVLVDDGKTVLRVERSTGGEAEAVVLSGGGLEPGKGVAVRGKHLPLPPITEKDRRSLDYLAGKPVSHVMMSYTSSAEHVRMLREELDRRGLRGVGILAKIETPAGVERSGEIAGESDGVVVARGDLGMHYPLELLPSVSQSIAASAARARKPLIIATEILASMIDRPIPTRAEIVDIYRSVELGADALLLTGETAIGRFPVQAVEWAVRTARRAWETCKTLPPRQTGDAAHRLALALVEMAEDLEAPIIVYSMSGRLPRRIASFKPRIPVYAGTPSEESYRALMILRSIYPLLVQAGDYVEGLERTAELASSIGVEGLQVLAAWSGETHTFQIKIKNIKY